MNHLVTRINYLMFYNENLFNSHWESFCQWKLELWSLSMHHIHSWEPLVSQHSLGSGPMNALSIPNNNSPWIQLPKWTTKQQQTYHTQRKMLQRWKWPEGYWLQNQFHKQIELTWIDWIFTNNAEVLLLRTGECENFARSRNRNVFSANQIVTKKCGQYRNDPHQ